MNGVISLLDPLMIGGLSLSAAVVFAVAFVAGEAHRAKKRTRRPLVTLEIRRASGERLKFHRVAADDPALQAALESLSAGTSHATLSGGVFDLVWEIEVPVDGGGVATEICVEPEAKTISDPTAIIEAPTGADTDPIVIDEYARPHFPSGDFSRRVDKLERIVAGFATSLNNACEVVGELTKSLLSDGITVYKERYVLEDNYAFLFVEEFRFYREALDNPSDRKGFERALTFGNRVRIEYEEQKVDMTTFCEAVTNQEVCAIIGLTSLLAIRAGFRKRK